MSDELNHDNFFQIWNTTQTNTPANKVEYRLYYNDQGFPLFYSMEQKPGNYVVVSKDFYTRPPKHIRVVDGKIRIYEHTTVKKLIPSEVGKCCHPWDVCVVVEEKQDHVKWSFKQEINEKYYDLET